MSVSNLARGYVWILLAICGVFILLPGQPLTEARSGLDESWRIALQVAFDRKLVFGQDFVFTYGPLGFLSSRLYSESTKWIIFCYDTWVALQFLFIWIVCFRYSRSVVTALFLATICLVLSGAAYLLDPPIMLFVLSTFWIFLDKKDPSHIFFLLSLVDSILSLYVKVNLGLAAFGQLAIVTFLAAAKNDEHRQGPMRFAALVILTFLSAWALHVDVFSYLIASLHLASGFNDAMYLESVDLKYLACALGVLSMLATALLITLIYDQLPILTASCAGFAFLLFKQAFVRSDEHIFVFFDYIVIPFALLAFHTTSFVNHLNATLLAVVIGISMYQCRVPLRHVLNTPSKLIHYWDSFIRPPSLSSPPTTLTSVTSEQIGEKTVDFMPENIALLFHAGLNWIPRPVIQSYLAYDNYLDRLNAQFLNAHGQQMVIMGQGCIDGRYCLYDETETKLALLANYDFVSNRGGMSVLARRSSPLQIKRRLIMSGQMQLGEGLPLPPSSSLQVAVFSIGYSLTGQARRILYKPAPLRITIASEHVKKDYRAVLPILRGGVIVNRSVDNEISLAKFLNREFDKLPVIDFVRIHSSIPRDFTEFFDYQIYEVVLEH